MLTGQLLAEELGSQAVQNQRSHPMDSSRLLLGLMTFARDMKDALDDPTGSLSDVISPGVLRSLLSALHFRDAKTVKHSRRVAKLAVGISEQLGWEPRDQKKLEVAALLHDVGKIGVPDSILFKPGKLNVDETELMALHHHIGIDVLQACGVDGEVMDIITQAHSQYGLAGGGKSILALERILGARILAVADAYESLSTNQAYREGKPHHEIIETLTTAKNVQFDENVVAALTRWIETEGNTFSNESPGEAAGPVAAFPEEPLQASSLGNIFSYLYVLESLYDGFYLVDSDLRFVVWNQNIERLLGRSSKDMLGQVWTSGVLGYADKNGKDLDDSNCPMRRAVAEGKAATSTLQIKTADHKTVEVELQSVPLFDREGRLHGVAEIVRDMSRTSRKPGAYRDLKLAASRDALTSVANRGELETQLAMMVAEFAQQNDPEPFSVIFLDIDHFKSINDTYGHTSGDKVLVEVARLLENDTYSGELVGRYGGEEFVILCPSTDQQNGVTRAERLRNTLARAQIAGLNELTLTASFGVTEMASGDSVESILRRADTALYKSKESGRNRTTAVANSDLLESASCRPDDKDATPFLYTGAFKACIAADMIVYKLGGYVNDHTAKLIDVSKTRAVVQVGRMGLMSRWGRRDKSKPVEMVIELQENDSVTRRAGGAASFQVDVNVEIRPLGRIQDETAFEARARQVFKDLRSFFVAD
jgi:diguanylate cyclase (GGDEF)-like protein/putative nucleotidyltransferase with HDIG domain/PAS domain S-box-containing protein